MFESLTQTRSKYLRFNTKQRIRSSIGRLRGLGLGIRILILLHLIGLSTPAQAADYAWDWATLNNFGPTIFGTGTYNYTNAFNSGLDAVVTISANFPNGGGFSSQPQIVNSGLDQELRFFPNFGARDPLPNRTDPQTATHTVTARIQFFESGTATSANITMRDLIIRDIDGSTAGFQDNIFVADTGGTPATGPTAFTATPVWNNDFPGSANNATCSTTGNTNQNAWAGYAIEDRLAPGFAVTHYAGNGCGDSNPNRQAVYISDFVFSTPDDFGDAPASYGDASHTIPATPTIYLGSVVPDGELTSQTSAAADGDDTTDTDDEDGVTFRSPAGTNQSIFADVAVVTGGANVTVCGWLDFPVDGTFGAGDVADGNCQTAAADGTLTFQWSNLPQDQSYTTYARFRVTSDAITDADATGAASDGEVEDYPVVFDFQPTHATIGEVSLEETAVADLLGELTGSGADLLALLAEWDPDQAASLDGDADATTIEQALVAYLDPDGDGAVALFRWTTIAEQGTVGFYVERREAEEESWERLNKGLLPALIDAPLGGEYWLADPDALSGHTYDYWLIEQEAWGDQREHGPWRLQL